MNNKIFKNLILFSCIMILLLFSNSTLVQSIANDETSIIVKNFKQFNEALKNANDGDVIYLDGSAIILDYNMNATIGYSDKTITIKKKSNSAYILLTSTKNIKFQNIIFDGENTVSYEPFIKTYGEYYPLASATFENVIFQNMNGNSDGILYLDTGLTTFNNCTFKNNKGNYGGHIEIRNNAIVNFYKCSFTQGQAHCGGAISLMSSDSSCNIFSSTITNNSANSEGGGIYNLGELTMENTKIYSNTASTGGSDIYNNGTLHIKDSIEDLQKLFPNSELKPIAWVSDYNDNSSYLKLEFGKIEGKDDQKEDENNQNNNSSNDTHENEDNNQNIESNNPNENNSDHAENNQQNTSNEEKEDNKSEQNQENASTPTFDKDNKNESVTNTLHNSEELSFIQKIIDKINETFNIQNPSTQTITDTSSKLVTNNHESPITPKFYISTSPLAKVDSTLNSNESESINPSNQSFNFSFEFKNNDNNNSNLIIIFVFIQSILVIFIFVIVIVQNKQNNRHHRYKNKKHTRKH